MRNSIKKGKRGRISFLLLTVCLTAVLSLGLAACVKGGDGTKDPDDPDNPPVDRPINPGAAGTTAGIDYPEASGSAYEDVAEKFEGLNIRFGAGKMDVIWEEVPGAASYDIFRAGSRLGLRGKIATVSKKGEVSGYGGWGYTDADPNKDKYENYYFIVAKSGSGTELKLEKPALKQHEKDNAKPFIDCQWISLEKKLFGDDTYFYDAKYDNMQAIGEEINYIGSAMQPAASESQMAYNRYAFYFKPGEYKGYVSGTGNGGRFSNSLWVAFNTSLSGLGITPDLTKIGNRLTSPAALDGNGEGGNVTHNFWRSVENFEMSDNKEFKWSVSQAAPARRIYVNGGQSGWENGGWASGGFTADCYFGGRVNGGGQQQWYTRNCHFESSFGGVNWNQVTQGSTYKGDSPPRPSNYTQGRQDVWIDETPLIREKPFLYLDENDGEYYVFVPGLREDSAGVSWMDDNGEIVPGEGCPVPLSEFYLAKPGDSAKKLNAKLAAGFHLFLTPGWYEAEEPIHVTLPDTIVLGTGLASVFPGQNNKYGGMLLDDVSGVTVAHVMFDAHYASAYLIRVGGMEVGEAGKGADHFDNPAQFSDVFCRVGGYMNGTVRADVSLQINSNNVIGDHCWLWGADHGRGGYTAPHGLIVSGDDVTLYGTFVEHYRSHQTTWFGNGGRLYFYQNESPYRFGSTQFAAYKVWNTVETHYAVGVGMYSLGTNITSGAEVPHKPGVKMEALFTIDLGGGETANVINGTGGSTRGGSKRVAVFENGVATIGGGSPTTAQGVAPAHEEIVIPRGPI